MTTKSVEAPTQITRQIAKETLDILIPYTKQLIELSRTVGKLSKLNEPKIHESEFLKLVDGLQTFSDTLIGVKQALHVGISPSTELLEVELLSTLQDLLKVWQEVPHLAEPLQIIFSPSCQF